MKILKKLVLFPFLVLVDIMSTSLKLIVKAECWVAGVGFLLLTILAILAAIKDQWMQMGIFVMSLLAVYVVLYISVLLSVIFEKLRYKL